jgi:hypothetical protein
MIRRITILFFFIATIKSSYSQALVTEKKSDCVFCNTCFKVKVWQEKIDSDCGNYAKITNIKNTVILFELCVLKADGKNDCRTDSLLPRTGKTYHFCNVGANFHYEVNACYRLKKIKIN